MTSEAQERRQAAYDNAVGTLHRVNPKIIPIAKLSDPCAIPLVVEQARQATPPAESPPSPEGMLTSRVFNMENAVAHLVDKAKRKGIPAELPSKEPIDLGRRLQMLNAMHDSLEKKIAYYNSTTQEQRAIDEIRTRLHRNEKRLDAIATAMAALGDLLPLLMTPAAGKVKDNA